MGGGVCQTLRPGEGQVPLAMCPTLFRVVLVTHLNEPSSSHLGPLGHSKERLWQSPKSLLF